MSGDSLDLDEKRPSKGLVSRVFHRRRQSHEKEHVFGHLEDRFIRIALRISLYPVSLIIVNGIIASELQARAVLTPVGDLYISAAGGVHSKTVYGLYCLYYFLYGARGIFFAAVSCPNITPNTSSASLSILVSTEESLLHGKRRTPIDAPSRTEHQQEN